MTRQWTEDDQARFDRSVARIKAARAAERPTEIECAHCGESIRLLFEEALPCPGCGRTVCLGCFKSRKLFAAQPCNPKGR